MVKSIVVVGALTLCAFLHPLYDLKATKMNMQCICILKLRLYEFELSHNAAESTKIIYCVKGESTIDHSIINRCFKKFCLGGKNIDDQARSNRPKTVNSEAML